MEFDPETLDTIGELEYADQLRRTDDRSPHHDVERNELMNYRRASRA